MKPDELSTTPIEKYINDDIFINLIYLFLNKPYLFYAFLYRTKNKLVKTIQDQIDVLNAIKEATKYIFNLEKEKSSSLLDSSIEFIKKNGVIDVTLYKEKVFKYLNTNTNIKSGTSEIALSNIDALEDIYTYSLYFEKLKNDINLYISNILRFDDIKSIDVYSYIYNKITNNIKNTLNVIEEDKELLSGITISNELISTVSLLKLIEDCDAHINPDNPIATLSVKPEEVVAESISNIYPQNITSYLISLKVDNFTTINTTFPNNNSANCPYILSNITQSSFVIPANTRLYIKIYGTIAPQIQSVLDGPGFNLPAGIIPIDLSGTLTFTQVCTQITNQLQVLDTGATLRQFGYCQSFADTSNRLLIFGNSTIGVSKIEIVPPPGFFDFLTNTYHQSLNSCNVTLGFNYSSNSINIPFEDLKDFLDIKSTNSTNTVEQNRLKIKSNTTGINSKIQINAGLLTDIGMVTFSGTPNYVSADVITDIENKDLISGTPISITNNQIYYDGITSSTSSVLVFYEGAKLTYIIDYLANIDISEQDTFNSVISPLLNNPTSLQIQKAITVIDSLISKLTLIKNDIDISISTVSEKFKLSSYVINLLQSKNYTKLIDMLLNGDFINFLNIISDQSKQSTDSSYNLTFMNKIEEVTK